MRVISSPSRLVAFQLMSFMRSPGMYSRMKYCSSSEVRARWVVSKPAEISTGGVDCSASSPGRTTSVRRSGGRICARVSPNTSRIVNRPVICSRPLHGNQSGIDASPPGVATSR